MTTKFIIDNKGWLIWSNEHNAWWRPNAYGYTENIEEAGRYILSDARKHCYQPEGGATKEVVVPSPELVCYLMGLPDGPHNLTAIGLINEELAKENNELRKKLLVTR
jgi:hypothetical protein